MRGKLGMSENSSSSNGAHSPPPRGALDGIADRMKRMLESGDLSDVQFEVGRDFGPTKIFRVHKYVLSSSSDVFYTMFYGSLPEKCDTTIDIPDVPEDAFEIMLKYIYTDKVDLLDEDNVYPTMVCADKYDLPRLADHCFDYILADLRAENCLHHLEKALSWGTPTAHIVENCLHFVDVYCQEVLGSEDFAEIKHSTLRRIVERDTFFAEEDVIYTAVNNWALAACARSKLEASPANRRKVLGQVLHLIRFPLMTDKQLADGPAGSGLLKSATLMEIYLHKHATEQRPVPSGLFPTQPRQFPLILVGSMELKHKEEIFVEDGLHWYPAQLLGTRGSAVVGLSLHFTDKIVKAEADQFIRASDILTAGQPIIWWNTSLGPWGRCKPGTYIKPDVDQRHAIDASDYELKLRLRDITVSGIQVRTWKKARADINGGNAQGGPQRKRTLDAANLV
ncbi:BTB/POZ domain-containing protein 6-like [Paramacrobiotus metropolitanus]|uniref:BTB/POZ domain-containing protein 6-like n=1 Tax=Paramacrobiotus metropolitanus TaxID=2943436 RepID=UPI002445DAAA|nr:BTB/POZ domain-containing protein 6-like [Paramacrobiotus metropolitanus]